MDVAASKPYTTGGLFAVGPDVAEILAVVTLSLTSLSLVCLNFDDDMVYGDQFENVW
jgi:hypothetical protein